MPEIRLENVTKYFSAERKRFAAIKDATLTIEQGEFVFIIGSSGAGKSTLLRLIASEYQPDEGRIFVGDLEISRLARWRRPLYRRLIGQVWQETRLIRKKTIHENLEVTMRASGVSRRKIAQLVPKVLGIVGMKQAHDKYPVELSGGESKRVELARAISNNPPILLIDELTANLDHDTAWDVVNLLAEINRCGVTVIMATHAKDFVNIMRRRVITLVDGEIRGDAKKGRYGDLS